MDSPGPLTKATKSPPTRSTHSHPFSINPELPQRSSAFITSSTKKRRLSPPSEADHELDSSYDLPLPSCEDANAEPSFSFSSGPAPPLPPPLPLGENANTASVGNNSTTSTHSYLRSDSQPASSLPPRLHTHSSSLAASNAAEHVWSTASSPSAAYADLNIDSDRETSRRSKSPHTKLSKRPMIADTHDTHHRSSSPLKRRASSMDAEPETNSPPREDVDMITVPSGGSTATSPRAMSVEVLPDAPPTAAVSKPTPNSISNSTASASTAAAAEGEGEQGLNIPPVSEQINIIKTLIDAFDQRPLNPGDLVFIVSRKWLARAEGKIGKASAQTGPLGPVDNSDLIQETFATSDDIAFSSLKPEVQESDYRYVPKEAWDLIISWYGLSQGQAPLSRLAQNQGQDDLPGNAVVENHPPILKFHRVWSANSPIPIDSQMKQEHPPPPRLVRPSSNLYNDVLRVAKQKLGIDMNTKVRAWRVVPQLPAGDTSIVVEQPQDSWSLLVESSQFLELEDGPQRDKIDKQDETGNPNYNGRSFTLAMAGLGTSMTVVLDEEVEQGTHVTTYSPTSMGKAKGPKTAISLQPRPNLSGRSSPALSGPVTRGRALQQQHVRRMTATCGLQNLGNTCYMNSALQCLRSVEELTKYFLTREAEREINEDNVLGHRGDVARAYSRLMEQFYSNDSSGYINPRQFRATIGRCGPMFSGMMQQDSQEFLGFLLDGLQEDLSRVKKKPYIEKPDSTDEMINDPEKLAEMAKQVWDITKKRDDSVIADLFVGMYKSTLVCPQCSKVSITFDPFNNLTLQLPVRSPFRRQVRFMPLNDKPVVVTIDIDRNTSIRGLKDFVSLRVGVPFDRLIVAENFAHKFYAVYKDLDGSVHEKIQANDFIDVFELDHKPTNWPDLRPPKKTNSSWTNFSSEDQENPTPHWDDPMAEYMLVPVLYRRTFKTSFSSKMDVFDPPHFIVLSREEARNEDIIRRKVLQKLATFTDWEPLKGEPDEESAESTEPEMVPSGGSDQDGGDTKVQAQSIDGEDDMVDVTMKNYSNGQTTKSSQYNYPLKQFNTKTPYWVKPDSFLPPQLQNIFEMSLYSDGGMIPKGTSLDADLPSLSARVAAQSPVLSNGNGVDGDDGDGHVDIDVDVDAEVESDQDAEDERLTTQTRMNEESDDELPPPIQRGKKFNKGRNKKQVRNQKGRKGGKKAKTYSKKGNKRQNRMSRPVVPRQPLPGSGSDDEEDAPLVRLGEGLVIDFTEDTAAMVFANSLDMSPKNAANALLPLDDPEVEEREKELSRRRKEGITLDMCLDEFEREEILAEEDQWYCPRCKDHVRATKKLELWKTPDVLVIHLKRFSNSGYRRDKIEVVVDFEVEDLNLAKRVIDRGDGKPEIYDLIAVDNHWGNLGGGHYTAQAKNFTDGLWYDYNDSSVSKVSNKSSIVSNSAYLLFYRRRSEVPLGGPRFKEIIDRFESGASQDDQLSESGEGQRLVDGSSLLGSSSALIGAEAAHRQESLGLVSGRTLLDHGAVSTTQYTAFPTLESEAENPLESIENDEGVDINATSPNVYHGGTSQSWSFANLTPTDVQNADDGDADSTQAVRSRANSAIGDNDSEFLDDEDMPGFTNLPDWGMSDGAPNDTLRNAVFIPDTEPAEEGPAAEIHLSDDEEDGGSAAPPPNVGLGPRPAKQ